MKTEKEIRKHIEGNTDKEGNPLKQGIDYNDGITSGYVMALKWVLQNE